MTSARTKPRWMSEWISPAACQAVRPRRRCQRLGGLVLARGEERDQVEQPERAGDDALQAGLADAELLAHRRRLLVVELGQLGLDPGGDRDRARARGGGVRRRRRAGTSSSPSSTLATKSTGLPVSGDEVAHRVGRVVRAAGTERTGPAGLQRLDDLRAATPPRRSRARSPPRASRTTRACRRSACSRSAKISSVSIVSMSAAGRPRPSGWMTLSSCVARTTCSSASVSRMLARNLLPSPSPSCAPATSPAMSWNSIVSADDVRGADRVARPRRGARRATGTTATFGSIVVNG